MLKKICFVFLLLSVTRLSFSLEYIPHFDVSMHVNPDGSARITETISVIAEHNQIRRGIYRDLPNKLSEKVHDFTLSMDGKTHPFFTENNWNTVRINFGNDNYLERGPHTYRFSYTMDNVVRLFPSHDEVYWNVTGSGWSFTIAQASFTLTLPEGAQIDTQRIASYVGRSGTRGVSARQDGLLFQAQDIRPGSDFTVAIPFQKGLITPTSSYYLRYLIWVILLGAMLLLWVYYGWAWNKVGRDPQAHIITQYEPPNDMSATYLLYVYTMGNGVNWLLPTAVVSLAMKDAIQITQESSFFGKKVFLEKKNGLVSPLLSSEEAMIYPALFRGKNKIKLGDPDNASAFQAIKLQLAHVLKIKSEDYFTTNAWYNLPTLIFLALGAGLISQWTWEFFLTDVIILAFVTLFAHSWPQKRYPFLAKVTSSCILLVMVGILACAMAMDRETIYAFVLLLANAVLGGFFMQWIKAYTPLGRGVMDHIEGFKQYLEVGEGGRVRGSDPTDSLRIFCDYLPYAYALGVESKWMKQFEKQFSAEQINHALSSRGFCGLNTADFSSSMSSAFSSLSSGAGGGGCAGGGSGGGGGGGR